MGYENYEADMLGPDLNDEPHDDNSNVCQYQPDHDYELIYQDDELGQWRCRRCGAESWEDLDE